MMDDTGHMKTGLSKCVPFWNIKSKHNEGGWMVARHSQALSEVVMLVNVVALLHGRELSGLSHAS
jgi:hypothetical protein